MRLRTFLADAFTITAGCSLYAIAVNMFTAPNNIAPGGATGLAIIVNRLTGFPIGAGVIIINIPLFLLARKLLNLEFFVKTAVSTLLLSVLIDVFGFLTPYTGNTLLAAIFGGVLGGIGLGLVFTRGATTGGSDLGGRLLKKIFRDVSMGRLILVTDGVVVMTAVIAFASLESGLFAVITIYVSSKMIDGILDGLDHARVAFIVSDKYQSIQRAIIEKVGRGATLLEGRGAYTGADRHVIMCAVKKYETWKLKKTVKETDPMAFMILSEASEILGYGFKPYEKAVED